MVYRFDFTGCGESGGNLKNVSLTSQVQDLKEITKFVKNQDIVNLRHLAAIGNSFGGTTLLAAKAKDFRAVVFTGTRIFYNEWRAAYLKRFNPTGVSYHWSYNRKKWKAIGPQFWTELDKYNLLQCIKSYKVPKLFIHGGQDSSVHTSNSWYLYDIATKPKEIKVFRTLDHTLVTTPEKYKLVDDLTKWLKKNL